MKTTFRQRDAEEYFATASYLRVLLQMLAPVEIILIDNSEGQTKMFTYHLKCRTSK